jgi:hypothetical protein
MTRQGHHCRPVGTFSPGASVYLASRFARRDEMRAIASELSAAGFLVTSRWLQSSAALTAAELEPGRLGGQLACMDLEDLRRAELLVAFTEEPDQQRPGRGGRHTELGIALGLGIGVVLVGPREHVFHTLPEIQQFPDWSSARATLFAARVGSDQLVTT